MSHSDCRILDVVMFIKIAAAFLRNAFTWCWPSNLYVLCTHPLTKHQSAILELRSGDCF